MFSLYSRWMKNWENRLANRDTNRVQRPFEWGLDWLGIPEANGNASIELGEFVRTTVGNSDSFFSYPRPADFQLSGSTLRFSSPIRTPYPENNQVEAEYFPAKRTRDRAVLVIPQWNSDENGHIGLCKLLNTYGLSALRLSPAYHHRRKPKELQRADYHMSSNIGRTIQAMRQSTVDARACLDWLEERGYKRLAILGTSLGSCVALLAAAHDHRLRAGVFNHVSLNVSDVVLTGVSCRHIRKSLDGNVSPEELRHYWSVISPSPYLDRLSGRDLKSLLIWARHDSTFLPEFSKEVLSGFRRRGLAHEVVCLPCGHYTSGKFPFNLWDGLAMCNFLYRML